MVILMQLIFIAAFVLVAYLISRKPAKPSKKEVDEIKALKTRVHTLERIIIDRDGSLRREIDGLS